MALKLKEQYLRRSIVELARRAGYYVIYPDCMEDIGIPDLLLIKKDVQSIFIELKTSTGKVKKRQEAKHKELIDQGLNVYVIRSINAFNLLIENIENGIFTL